MSEAVQTKLMNMVRIENRRGEVLVLDKVRRKGWEGLTFPGGKVEPLESIEDSVRREAYEETGLTLGPVSFCGIVSWVYADRPAYREVGLLYRCASFTGALRDSREGALYWVDAARFDRMEPKSDSMDDILRVYRGEAFEVIEYYDGMRKVRTAYR